MGPASGLAQTWGWHSWYHLPWSRRLPDSPGGPRYPATKTSFRESWGGKKQGWKTYEWCRLYKTLLAYSPNCVDGSLIVSCVNEGIRFDPNREPVQVGDTLDNIHRHGSHFGSFDRERKKTWKERTRSHNYKQNIFAESIDYRCEANERYCVRKDVFTNDCIQGERALSENLFVACHGRTFLTSFLVQVS